MTVGQQSTDKTAGLSRAGQDAHADSSPLPGQDELHAHMLQVRKSHDALHALGFATSPKPGLRELEPYFARVLPRGTAVVVNLRTFEFVHAPTRAAALKLFVTKFGRDASGWAFDVGRPVTLGGGECTSRREVWTIAAGRSSGCV